MAGTLEVFQDFERKCGSTGLGLDLSIHLKNLIAFATGQSRFLSVGGLSLNTLQSAWADCKRGMEFALNFLKNNVGIDSPSLLSSPFLVVTVAYLGHQRQYNITPEESERLRYWALTANAKGRIRGAQDAKRCSISLATYAMAAMRTP